MTLPSASAREQMYEGMLERIFALLDGESDWIAAMATCVCELHHAFTYFHWTGFYRLMEGNVLVIGPYQGTHGCLRIPVGKGVCGTVVKTGKTSLIDDVNSLDNHIACSNTTRSEIVVPIVNGDNEVVAVLDVDSDFLAAFDSVDQRYLEKICKHLSERFFP